ncbi:hypothetical protein MJ904_21290 [Massilia sp. MB5]|uniref:hypothetical protein n=1 Tax=Massilia sp. MB5 TaxID=2919578 RepID=UPI001F0D64F5|nr:hypothetical protein [Massilia sp. MB5]UMR29562.1 hypothetical protein MJ904_21290 [Massilia sp. MB5]
MSRLHLPAVIGLSYGGDKLLRPCRYRPHAMLRLHRNFLIAAALAMCALPFLYAALGAAKPLRPGAGWISWARAAPR